MIKVQNIHKSYNKLEVLKGINIEIKKENWELAPSSEHNNSYSDYHN